jgi:predicted RNase H-like HicB family nuclease
MGDSIEYCEQCDNRVGCHLERRCFRVNDKADGPLDATACSAAVPLGKRGPIEIHTGAVMLTVHAQQEPDGTWAAMVPDLTQSCQSAATREEAIRLACEAVSVCLPNDEMTSPHNERK